MQTENTNVLYDENGNVRAKMWAALTISKETNGTEIEVDEYYNTPIEVGDELIVASSNEKATIVSINGNTILVDKHITSADSEVLKCGELLKIHNN